MKSTVLSAFKSLGDSKLGAVTKVTVPMALSMDNRASSFDPAESTKEYVKTELRSSSEAEIVATAEEFSGIFDIAAVEIDGASATSVTRI